MLQAPPNDAVAAIVDDLIDLVQSHKLEPVPLPSDLQSPSIGALVSPKPSPSPAYLDASEQDTAASVCGSAESQGAHLESLQSFAASEASEGNDAAVSADDAVNTAPTGTASSPPSTPGRPDTVLTRIEEEMVDAASGPPLAEIIIDHQDSVRGAEVDQADAQDFDFDQVVDQGGYQGSVRPNTPRVDSGGAGSVNAGGTDGSKEDEQADNGSGSETQDGEGMGGEGSEEGTSRDRGSQQSLSNHTGGDGYDGSRLHVWGARGMSPVQPSSPPPSPAAHVFEAPTSRAAAPFAAASRHHEQQTEPDSQYNNRWSRQMESGGWGGHHGPLRARSLPYRGLSKHADSASPQITPPHTPSTTPVSTPSHNHSGAAWIPTTTALDVGPGHTPSLDVSQTAEGAGRRLGSRLHKVTPGAYAEAAAAAARGREGSDGDNGLRTPASSPISCSLDSGPHVGHGETLTQQHPRHQQPSDATGTAQRQGSMASQTSSQASNQSDRQGRADVYEEAVGQLFTRGASQRKGEGRGWGSGGSDMGSSLNERRSWHGGAGEGEQYDSEVVKVRGGACGHVAGQQSVCLSWVQVCGGS